MPEIADQFDLVDRQQRVTTLTLLRARICDRLAALQGGDQRAVLTRAMLINDDKCADHKPRLVLQRLEDLKNRHEHGNLASIDFLKELLELAKDVVRMEREAPPAEEIDPGKAALTQLFEEAKNGETPVMVQRVVDNIDEIVRAVRFDGWHNTHAGEREGKALRKTLFKYNGCRPLREGVRLHPGVLLSAASR